ncbi:MAG: hypothetical protein H6773_04120 [Pseudomonadales bacterium]|nr:hypothetical protein [Candidatus Woesebacteria bacterium]MCB9801345.1 hypothetical protein [Pseudomonadales bacterium]
MFGLKPSPEIRAQSTVRRAEVQTSTDIEGSLRRSVVALLVSFYSGKDALHHNQDAIKLPNIDTQLETLLENYPQVAQAILEKIASLKQ